MDAGGVRGTGSTRRVPYPGVVFPPSFPSRLESFVLRASAATQRREGAGSAALLGAGEEFVGYRPYRPGEDLRDLAWDLLARLDRPFVRVTRREASEQWTILLDTSASMGVGPPGKLQAAAELAAAVACVALRGGARIELFCSDGAPAPSARRVADLGRLLAFLGSRRAGGSAGLADLVASRCVGSRCGRVVLIGDCLDLAPELLGGLRAPGRELLCAQVLAPIELAPPHSGAVEWLDPEGGADLRCELSRPLVESYERALGQRLAAWDALAARHAFRHTLHPSDRPFEEGVRALLEV